MASQREQVRRVSIFINGNEADATLKQLEKGSKQLRNELARLVPGTEAFKTKMAELKQVNKVLQDVRDDIKGVGGAFGWLKTEIGKFGVLAAGYLGFDFITSKFKDIISQNAKLSDSVADVMKTTGLSETAVRRLNQEFRNIDTRSSREELNGLARVAGKLGISAEQDVLAFVRAADQISVALGEDLGGAEEAINHLGKLVDIFKLKDEYGLEQSLLNVGSAINELGAAGTANEAYLVEFTKRMGGIAPAANISIQDILGLAATMDELGQPVEASATAIGQFIVGLGKDIPAFAKIAGMSVQEFSTLLKTDGNQALIAVLKNLNSTGQGVAGLAEKMGMIGEEGARATTALGVLSNNVDLLQKRQQLSNEEFERGLSLTDEFSVRNNNFAAQLDKLGKNIGSLTSNFTLQDFLIKTTQAFSNGVTWITKNAESVAKWIKILTVGGAALLTYRTYLMLTNTAMFQYIATMITGEKVTILSRTATIALAGAKALLSGNLTKAAQAWRLLNITMAANPAGAILAGIVAITGALYLFNSGLSVAAKSQKDFNDIKTAAAKKVAEESEKLKELNKVRIDENASLTDKIRAVQKIRELYPDILKGLTDEEALTNRGTTAINKYIQALDRKTTAEAASAKISELKQRNMDLSSSDGSSDGNWANQGFQAVYGAIGLDSQVNRLRGYNKDRNTKEIKENEARIKELQESYGGMIQENLLGGKPSNETNKIDIETSTSSSKTLESLKQKVEDLKKQREVVAVGSKEFVALGKEIIALEKEINKYDDSASASKQESAAEKTRKKMEALKKDIYAWQNKAEQEDPDSDKELVQIEQKYQELLAKAIGHQDQIDIIEHTRTELRNQRLSEIQKEWDEKNRKEALEQIDQAYAEEESILAQRLQQRLEAIDASDRSEIEKRLAKEALIAEFDNSKFEKEQENLTAKALLLEAQILAGNLELEEEQRLTQEKMNLQKQVADNAIANQQMIADKTAQINESRAEAERSLQLAIVDAYQQGFSLISGLFAQNSAAAKAFFVLEKIAAAAKVVLSLQQELAALRLQTQFEATQAAAIPVVGPGLALGIKAKGAAEAVKAKIAAGISLATIGAQTIAGFEDGGYSAVDYSNPNGWVRRPTMFMNSSSGRPFIAGEKYKSEYIISSEQLKDPLIADFVGMMESRRGISKLENGGYSGGQPIGTTPGTGGSGSTVEALMRKMIEVMEGYNDKKVVLSYQQFENHQNRVVEIRNNVTA